MTEQSAASGDERPLVTLAVFGYNQERFVAEAIEGAFAQTYRPLEIILSDDCSTDGTFAIMERMAAEYQGLHRVRAVRHDPNLGTVRHVIEVARLAEGNLLVVNAGDDISHPDRVAVLQREWNKTGASALSSFYDEFAEDGALLRTNCSFPPSLDTQWLFRGSKVARRVDGFVQSVPGFCAAYERSFWAALPMPADKLFVEDGLATILMNIQGRTIHRVAESLISYRLVSGSASNRNAHETTDAIIGRERKISLAGGDIDKMISYVFAALPDPGAIEPQTFRTLEDHRRYGRLTRAFWEASPGTRLRMLFSTRSSRELRFALPRLFGTGAFVASKKIYERARRG